MLAKISERIVEWQINKGVLAKEESAVYQYAYELLLNQIINILLAVLVAAGFRNPLTVLIFLSSYIPMRSFCGGYHARTNFRCTIISTGILFIVCYLANLVRGNQLVVWYPLAFIVSGILVFKYAPVPDENKPLNTLEVTRYRKASYILWGIEALIGIVFHLLGKWNYGVVIAIAHIILAFMLFVGHIRRQLHNF